MEGSGFKNLESPVDNTTIQWILEEFKKMMRTIICWPERANPMFSWPMYAIYQSGSASRGFQGSLLILVTGQSEGKFTNLKYSTKGCAGKLKWTISVLFRCFVLVKFMEIKVAFWIQWPRNRNLSVQPNFHSVSARLRGLGNNKRYVYSLRTFT